MTDVEARDLDFLFFLLLVNWITLIQSYSSDSAAQFPQMDTCDGHKRWCHVPFRTGQQEMVIVFVGLLAISSLGLHIYYRIQGCLEFEKGTRQWWQQLGKPGESSL